MMMKKMLFPLCGLIVVGALSLGALLSCSARIDASLRTGGAAALSLRAALEPRTAALLRSFQVLTGSGGGPILDGPALARSLAAAPGIASASFNNIDAATVEGAITISRINDFLTPVGGGDRRFITWEESGSGGSLRIRLDRDSAPAILPLISPEVTTYLEALMAPAVTGERISRSEYVDLVASVYGRPLAGEISAAKIQLSLELPRPVTSIRGGTASGNRAQFELPLADILVLENPLIYEVAWR